MSEGGGDYGGGGGVSDPGASGGGGGKGSSGGGGGDPSGGDSKGNNSGGNGVPGDVAVYDPSYDPTSYGSTGGNTGPSVSDFVNDPTGGNLTGPGPAGGGSSYLPGDSSPYAFDNSSYLPGADVFSGQPMSAGGSVFDTGTDPIPGLSGTSGQSVFETAASTTAAAPAGASAAGVAAPSAVAGNPDASSSAMDFSSLGRKSSDGAGSGNSSGGSDILSSLGIGKNNGLSSAVAGLGLVNNLVNGNKSLSQTPQLNANAAAASSVGQGQISAGQALQQWQTTGKLPDSYESQIQQAAEAAKTKAIANAASSGLPTDPRLNTTLAAQLNAIDAAIPQQREQIAAGLAQSGSNMVAAGLTATGISSDIYTKLAQLEDSQNKARGQAITNFAAALNGGNNKGLTLKVA